MKTGYSFGSLVSFTEALDAAAVKITGDQTIAGLKTFSSNPITSATQGSGGGYLTRKDYVDGALALKAPLASPTLTGTPKAPTAAAGTNTTQLATTAFVTSANTALLANAAPLMDGTATVGTSTLLARQDHIHPTDTSRAPLASPALTGTPTAPTAAAGTNTTQIATTAFVTASNTAQLGTGTPLMDGTAAVGTSTLLSRQDHRHPIDTSRAPLASPALTGTPTAPTAVAGTNTTQLATTAFVTTAIVAVGSSAAPLTRKDYVDGCFEFIPIIANITVSSPRNYRFMAYAIATLPSSGGSIRFIVDHSVDLTSGDCVIQAPAGETIVAPRGSDNQVRIKQVGREFVFVRINNQWRVS